MSLLLLPAVASGQLRRPQAATSGAGLSVKFGSKPHYEREFGNRTIFGWRGTVTVARGSHLVILTHTNAAEPTAAVGVTQIKTSELMVEAGRPLFVDLLTWGPPPKVGARIKRTLDATARAPANDPAAAQEPSVQEPAQAPAEQPPATQPPAESPPAARPAPTDPPPTPGVKSGPRRPGRQPVRHPGTQNPDNRKVPPERPAAPARQASPQNSAAAPTAGQRL